jgi:mannose/cellobiose epimerase-like protein (N-acyl-D-glucosamine 2-epimerase family)
MANRTKRTPQKDGKFLATLAKTADVTVSAKAAGYSRRSVYEWRENDETWRENWEDAWHRGVDAMEEEARRRAIDGVNKAVYHKGKIVGYEKVYSDNLLMFMLKARRPETFRDNSSVEHIGKGGAPLDFTVSFVSPTKATP